MFHSLRPDIVLVKDDTVITLELTVCHELNLRKSKMYKLNKYKDLYSHVMDQFTGYTMKFYTIEVTTLGFV